MHPSKLSPGLKKQLLFDDAIIEVREGFTPVMNPTLCTHVPVLAPEKPWEQRGCSAPTVMLDEGVYRMWYCAGGQDGVPRCCYATSTDGMRWERPDLGLIDYEGRRDNNIVLMNYEGSGDHNVTYFHHGSMFKDPVDRPERRFKCIYGGGHYAYESVYAGGARFRYDTAPPATWRYPGVAGAYSADGIRWTAYEDLIMPWYTDTNNVAFWDDRIRKYVAYVRWNEYLRVENDVQTGSFDYRAIGRTESEAFEHFPLPEKILEPDFTHPEDADMWGGGLYDSAALKYPFASDAYFIFTAAYHHTNDTLDVELATSRDGVHFTRWREPFVRLGPAGAFDSMMIYMGIGMLPVGDEIWLYYGGFDRPHDQVTEQEYAPAIGYARIRLDGFVSQDAPGQGGVLTTRPFVPEGDHLEMNLDGSSRGWLKVEILDETMQPLEGFTEKEADRLSGNDVRHVATWGGKRDLSAVRGKTVRLRFTGQSVKLYAFQFARSD